VVGAHLTDAQPVSVEAEHTGASEPGDAQVFDGDIFDRLRRVEITGRRVERADRAQTGHPPSSLHGLSELFGGLITVFDHPAPSIVSEIGMNTLSK
jgi:hypothetical protein